MTQDTQTPEPSARAPGRIIDLKLPLPWLLTTAGAIVMALYGMYFKLDQLGVDVTDLKVTVKSGNSATATVQGELAILKFRIENLEAEKRHAGGSAK